MAEEDSIIVEAREHANYATLIDPTVVTSLWAVPVAHASDVEIMSPNLKLPR